MTSPAYPGRQRHKRVYMDDSKGTHKPEYVGTPDRGDVERFRHLSYELLTYSARGLLRRDFLPMVAETIRKHCGCDGVELWVKEDANKHYRCLVTDSKRMPHGFILVPCPLGEPTDASLEDRTKLSMERLCCNVIKGEVDEKLPYVTERGSFWASEAPEALDQGWVEKKAYAPRAVLLPEPYKSYVIIPIRIERDCIGILQLKSKKPGFFPVEKMDFYEDIADVLGIALSHQYAQIELRERIKEITCLYGIAQVIAQPDASFDGIIQAITNLLPPGWLFPEITCARIVLDGRSYRTENYKECPDRQIADVVVRKEKVGFVEVAYLEKKLTLDEGPFLAEERNLINSVAREVAIYYERAKAEQEKESLQEQLRHADRLATIGQLAAGVAHELNEPLGNILGFAQLAIKSNNLPVQVQRDLKSIETASLNAREIIKKLMTFARQLPPRKKSANLNNIVSDGMYFFEARCAKAGIQMNLRLAGDLPPVVVDPGQITQVLVNLVVNAVQAMPRGGKLTVETRADDKEVCLVVEDTGSGIGDEIKGRIFLPFFTTKDVNEGTGLGLAVAHGIVSSHKGTITVETEIGKGSRFVVHLPRTGSTQPDEKTDEKRN